MNHYKEQGYGCRDTYLISLSEMYGVDIKIVEYLADLLGENEDFDGLVTSLEDMSQGY